MTDRERWIVYPLLLMSLGISLRGKFVPSKIVLSEKVVCEELEIVGEDKQSSHVMVRLGKLNDAADHDDNKSMGAVEIYNWQGKPLAKIGGLHDGKVGAITLRDTETHVDVTLGPPRVDPTRAPPLTP